MNIAGLRAVLESSGTLHAIEMPPERAHFLIESAYEHAYEEWWVRTHCWESISDPHSPEDSEPDGQWELQ